MRGKSVVFGVWTHEKSFQIKRPCPCCCTNDRLRVKDDLLVGGREEGKLELLKILQNAEISVDLGATFVF